VTTPELPYTSRVNAGTSDVVTTSTPVEDTTDDALYYTRRWGKSFGYSQVVPNGTYTVQLGFYDPDKTAAGQRVFDVLAEGQTKIDNLDLFATASIGRPSTSCFP
jgi:hypothetical protein